MSFLVVVPEFLTSAAADVENIGSTLRAANAAAAASTTALAAAGADEVSAAVAALFARFGQEYQAVSAQASAFHQQFVQTLNSASGSYAAAEATIASQLQTAQHDLLGAVNAPTETLLGRPLIGDGAPGTATSPNGGAGGLLYGNGGNGYSATASGGRRRGRRFRGVDRQWRRRGEPAGRLVRLRPRRVSRRHHRAPGRSCRPRSSTPGGTGGSGVTGGSEN